MIRVCSKNRQNVQKVLLPQNLILLRWKSSRSNCKSLYKTIDNTFHLYAKCIFFGQNNNKTTTHVAAQWTSSSFCGRRRQSAQSDNIDWLVCKWGQKKRWIDKRFNCSKWKNNSFPRNIETDGWWKTSFWKGWPSTTIFDGDSEPLCSFLKPENQKKIISIFHI